ERRDRIEMDERIDHRGRVIGPLEESSVVEAARILSRRGINCVAVCLMHSYLNNTNERMVRDILEREMPGALISISSEVLSEFREYERSSTTALNAYLAPIAPSSHPTDCSVAKPRRNPNSGPSCRMERAACLSRRPRRCISPKVPLSISAAQAAGAMAHRLSAASNRFRRISTMAMSAQM